MKWRCEKSSPIASFVFPSFLSRRISGEWKIACLMYTSPLLEKLSMIKHCHKPKASFYDFSRWRTCSYVFYIDDEFMWKPCCVFPADKILYSWVLCVNWELKFSFNGEAHTPSLETPFQLFLKFKLNLQSQSFETDVKGKKVNEEFRMPKIVFAREGISRWDYKIWVFLEFVFLRSLRSIWKRKKFQGWEAETGNGTLKDREESDVEQN